MHTTIAEHPLHTDFLAGLLARTEPELHAHRLLEETDEEAAARRAAAADITDDLIASWPVEVAARVAQWTVEAELEVAVMGVEAAVKAADMTARVQAEVASWLDQIRGAAA